MTARAVLWHHRPRKNGSCNVKIYVYHEGKKTYTATPFHVRPEHWDADAGRLKPGVPLARRVNPVLVRLENEALGVIMDATSSLLRLVDLYIEECEQKKHTVSPNTLKQYRSHRNRLLQYVEARGLDDLGFHDIDMGFHRDFTAYLQANGCGLAGTGKHIRQIKMFMRVGLERQLHDNTVFQSRAFKAQKVTPTNQVYLSKREIEAVEQVDLSDKPSLARERDRFLISYYLILRYGDSVNVSAANVLRHDGKAFYRNVAEKTGTVSVVPIKPAALAILERYDYDLSGSTNQEANRRLKRIASMAGIVTNQAPPGQPYESKASMVTTHTARRSAATNMLLDGLPVPEIMQLGGWKREATFRSYILAGGVQLAQLSSGRSFFQ